MVNGEICIGLFALSDIKKVFYCFLLLPSCSFTDSLTERISMSYDLDGFWLKGYKF